VTLEAASLLKGAMLGFAIAAPVGPIGALCIRRTLAEGRMVGLATGLGAAAADGIYGACAALGLAAVTQRLAAPEVQTLIRAFGGALLLWMGWSTLTARATSRELEPSAAGLLAAFGTTFALTIANPMTILSFLAVFAGLGIGSTAGHPMAALLLVAGVVMGSAAWWLALSGVVSLVRRRVEAGAMLWVNRISGSVIIGFGLAALASVLVRK